MSRLWCGLLLAGLLMGCKHSAPVHEQGSGDSAHSARAPAVPSRRELGEGLVVTELTPGSGAACTAESIVEVNFVAMLADGTVWDSSERRKRSIEFNLADPGLIKGLGRGVPGMRVGGKRRIEIPWMLGYGATGRDPVPPKADLIFEVELLSVRDAAAPVK